MRLHASGLYIYFKGLRAENRGIGFSGLPSHNIVSFSQRDGKQNNAGTRKQSRQALSRFQDSCRDREALQTRVSGSGGYLCYCVTRATMPDGSSVTRTPPILVKMPPHWLVRGMLNPSPGRSRFATIQLQLQIFSSTRGFEAIQIWWLLHSSWRGDAESWALHWYALFTYCLCVHLLIWRTDAAQFLCGGHSGRLARITIIWHYPAVSWNFKQSDNS